MWRTEGNLQESLLSYPMGPGDQTQITGFGGKSVYS